ncbi:MAG: hypothetical protein AAFQ57_06300 [Cyanobacteria bacterium J06626_14]
MPTALATGLLALAYITTYSVSESYNSKDALEATEQLVSRGQKPGTAHRGSGRRAVLAYQLPTAEVNS